MKKYLKIVISISILLITTTAFAFDWGIFAEYDEESMDSYALYKAIHGIPIKYTVYTLSYDQLKMKDIDEGDPSTHKLSEIISEVVGTVEEEKMVESIEQAFYTWFEDTWAMIEEDGRTKEFEDIKDILLSKIKLKKVSHSAKDADLLFIFSTPNYMHYYCGEDAGACIIDLGNMYAIIVIHPSYYDNQDYALAATIHEIGHYFALSDQYKEFKHNSLIHSTEDRIGNYASVMGANYDTHLSCDDVDGFINLIDLTLYFENRYSEKDFMGFSKRAFFGWKSFCSGKENNKGEKYPVKYYHEAKPLFKKSQTVEDRTYYFESAGIVYYSIDEYNNVYDRNNNLLFYYIKDENDIYSYYDKDDNLIKQTDINPHYFANNLKELTNPQKQ